MDKIKALVADDNSLVREILVDALSGEEDIEIVATATNGKETIEAINMYEPNVVLLDLIMPIVDGMGVMEAVRENTKLSNKPYFVIISAAGKEDIISQALDTGASYFFMKPFDEAALIRKIRQLFNKETKVNTEPITALNETKSVDNDVTDLMRKTMVPIKMVGYKYLKEAIVIAIEDPESLMSITKSVYPQVADKFDTSSGNVERNIRYVIEAAWNKLSEGEMSEDLKAIFGKMSKKPTNSEFILSCSEWIRYKA